MQNATHRLDAAGTFTLISSGRVLSVTASQKRGRWQYRADGKLIASGIEPARFVAEYWFGTLEVAGAAEGGVIASPSWPCGCPLTLDELADSDPVNAHHCTSSNKG